MTQEEKDLLLKDLCARLLYDVKCNALLKQIDGSLKSVFGTFKGYNGWATVGNNLVDIETVRPYLRPMSSMTKDEIKEFDEFCVMDEYAWRGGSIQGFINQAEIMQNGIDWLNAHHFDYRGLIDKGLALEAPEGMY